jgi:hypothetical protein
MKSSSWLLAAPDSLNQRRQVAALVGHELLQLWPQTGHCQPTSENLRAIYVYRAELAGVIHFDDAIAGVLPRFTVHPILVYPTLTGYGVPSRWV